MDISLSELWEMVKDRGARSAAVRGVAKNQTWLSNWTITTKTTRNNKGNIFIFKESRKHVFYKRRYKEWRCIYVEEKERNFVLIRDCCCCCWVASVVSNSVRPHRRQPTRLCRPWDSPGKNTGVGCHLFHNGKEKKCRTNCRFVEKESWEKNFTCGQAG